MKTLLLCLYIISALACKVRIDLTVDNEITVLQVGTTRFAGSGIPNYNDYTKAGSVYATGDHLAIEMKNWGGGVGNPSALLAAITVLDDNNKVYPSDATWKCSKVLSKGWETRDFDDSAWANAVSYGNHGDAPWGRIPGISTTSKWIWTPGGNTFDETIWCRKSNFCPTVPREAPTQSVCEMTAASGGAAAAPTVVPPQKILAVAVVPTNYQPWSDIMAKHLTNLVKTKYTTSTFKYQLLSGTSTLPDDLDSYTQVWIYDLAHVGDATAGHVAQFKRIAKWYNDRPGKNVIVDGRILSESYAVPGYPGESRYEVYENYFANLAIRGGGLMLGTDHDVFANGINIVNDDIGISRFYSVISGTKCNADKKSPLMTWPNYAPLPDGTLMDHTSTSITPYNAQANGIILYPLCWHTILLSAPAIASTIRGDAGFTVSITNPPCDSWFPAGTTVKFESAIKGGGSGKISYSWSSNLGGYFGFDPSVSWTPPIGRNIIKLTAIDDSGLVADFFIAITITYRSKNVECFTTEYNGKQVKEVFPITSSFSASAYYNLVAGNAQTPAKIESTLSNSANFFLYQDPAGTLSLVNIMSKNTGESKYSFTMKSDLGGKGTKMDVLDDLNDRHTTWDTAAGTGASKYDYQGTTKGWILGGLPNTPTKYFCFELDYDQVANFNMATAAFWGLPTEDPKGLPQYWGHDVTRADKLKICRRECTCPPLDVRDSLTGSMYSLTIIFGKEGSTDHYDDTDKCDYRIKPTPKGGPVAGIGIHFEQWLVAAGDTLTIFKGESTAGSVALTANTASKPVSFSVTGGVADVQWRPNKDGKYDAGWKLRFYAIPTLISLPKTVFGFSSASNVAEITGANFVNSPLLKVFLDGAPLETTFVSETLVQAKIPIQPYSNVGKQLPLKSTNDGVYFSNEIKISFADVECGAQKTCLGCSKNPKCSFCNNLGSPAGSYCFESASGRCTPDKQIVDKGCCTQCIAKNGCNTGGECQCDDTCKCDAKHWGDACECLTCPTTVTGKSCSGNGKCNCNGTCTCEPGWWGPDCSCKNCGGTPSCNGHGKCNCDGTCTCDVNWKHKIATVPICDCPLICPQNNCNGHGTCGCGTCTCFFDAVGEFCQNISICGDSKIEYNEKCDDGNKVAGDGCDALCRREPGWNCPAPGTACTPICGDGNTFGNEGCDDGNQVDGDGCNHNCQVEAGWVCVPPNAADALDFPQSLCCKDFPSYMKSYTFVKPLRAQLTCTAEGWWHGGPKIFEKPAKPENTLVAFKSRDPTEDDELVFNEDAYICGILEVSIPMVINRATLHVAGTFRIKDQGRLILRNGGRLVIHDHCDGEGYVADNQLILDQGATIGIQRMVWENATTTPELPIWVNRCVDIDYDAVLHLSPSVIPRGENAFTFIWSNHSCVVVPGRETQINEGYEPFVRRDLDLPGGCSDAYTSHDEEGKTSIYIHIKHKDLCPGQIAGIVIASVFGAAILGAGCAFAMGLARAPGGFEDYSAL